MVAMHLVGELRPALVVHITCLLFGERGDGKRQVRFRRRAVGQQIEHGSLPGGVKGRVDLGVRGAAIKIVFEHDDVGRLAGIQFAQGFAETVFLPGHQVQAHAVDFGRQQAEIHRRRVAVTAAFPQCSGDIGRGLDQIDIAVARPGDDQRPARREQLSGDPRKRFMPRIGLRCGCVDSASQFNSVLHEPRRRVDDTIRSHVVQPGGATGEYAKRAAFLLGEFAHRGVLPARNIGAVGQFQRLVAHRLAQGECDARRGIGEVFAEYEHGVGLFHFPDGGIVETRIASEFGDQLHTGVFGIGIAHMKILFADQLAQGEIGFVSGSRRAYSYSVARDLAQLPLRRFRVEFIARAVERSCKACGVVHIARAETAAVANEIAVQLAMIAIDDAAQFPVALARRDVAAHAAAVADRRRGLQVPFARVVLAENLVGEDPGRTNLDQVAAEFAFQRAVPVPSEIGEMMRGLGRKIFTAGVLVVETHAAITGDAAIHLVIDERAEILVAVRDLLLVVAAVVVARHQGHVLQMAFAAFLANRAVVRMADHQAFDDAGPKGFCLGIFDGNPRAWLHRGHARHGHQAGAVFCVAILLDRALAAGAHRAHAGMPAEIRQVEPQRQAFL